MEGNGDGERGEGLVQWQLQVALSAQKCATTAVRQHHEPWVQLATDMS